MLYDEVDSYCWHSYWLAIVVFYYECELIRLSNEVKQSNVRNYLTSVAICFRTQRLFRKILIKTLVLVDVVVKTT